MGLRARRRAWTASLGLLLGPFLAVGMARTEEVAKADQPTPPPPPKAAGPATPTSDEITPDKMQGISFEGLTDAQKELAFSILKDNKCGCGCGLTFAACRVKDSKCTRSLEIATRVISLVKEGKNRDAILKAAIPPAPWNFVQFPLTAGDAPALGPADAKVTILHYLDYQ